MGQRSQIYIYWKHTNPNGGGVQEGFIARYLPWNFGDRMVSRGRYLLEKLSGLAEGHAAGMSSLTHIALRRMADVNFDMKDVVASTNLLEECKAEGSMEYLFNQDNNDGFLVISMDERDISYAFVHDDDIVPLDPEQYMRADVGVRWAEDLAQAAEDDNDDVESAETLLYTRRNIKAIHKMPHVRRMTKVELKQFLDRDYSQFMDNEITYNGR